MRGTLKEIKPWHYEYKTETRTWKINKASFREHYKKQFINYWRIAIIDERFLHSEAGVLPIKPLTLDDAIYFVDVWEENNA